MYIKQSNKWRIKYHFLMVYVYQLINQPENQISLLNGQCISINYHSLNDNLYHTINWLKNQLPWFKRQSIQNNQLIDWRMNNHCLKENLYQTINSPFRGQSIWISRLKVSIGTVLKDNPSQPITVLKSQIKLTCVPRINNGDGQLLINPVVNEDHGVWRCRATNKLGSDEASALIIVHCKSSGQISAKSVQFSSPAGSSNIKDIKDFITTVRCVTLDFCVHSPPGGKSVKIINNGVVSP